MKKLIVNYDESRNSNRRVEVKRNRAGLYVRDNRTAGEAVILTAYERARKAQEATKDYYLHHNVPRTVTRVKKMRKEMDNLYWQEKRTAAWFLEMNNTIAVQLGIVREWKLLE